MKLTENARIVLNKRYLLKNNFGDVVESPEAMARRVASAVDRSEGYEEDYFEIIDSLKFLPNSPTLMNAGTGQGTLSACFVLPLNDSMGEIMNTAKSAALVQKFGGGTGFALSRLRQKGAPISTTHGKACGPISVLRMLSSVSSMVTQGGKRDGANMAVLRVDHPDIEEFITCKSVEGEIHNFNISVGLTDVFMTALQKDESYDLVEPHTRVVVGKKRARDIWNLIIDGAWKNGEPGAIFLDTVNREHSKMGIGDIEATNPCGEQPLLPNESCNLGSINVAKMVREDKEFDYTELDRVVKLAIRFLDNVIDENKYATKEIESQTKATRKVGLGVMGWADALIKMAIPYTSNEAISKAEELFGRIKEVADKTSEELAQEKGAYPASIDGKYRNACRMTIAPTGTISMIADASSGIEPLFRLGYTKHNILEGETLTYINEEFKNYVRSKSILEFVANGGKLSDTDAGSFTKRLFATADEIPYEAHVKMQAAFQKYCDSGVSKTINLPNEAKRSDVSGAYLQAWLTGCKGITVYRAGSRFKEVLTEGLLCPECKGKVVLAEGCKKCLSCGWSAC